MSSREQSIANPSYEDVLEAVQETDRGRWFLAEYRNRAHAAELAQLEAAIARIEQRLDFLPGAETQSGEWARAKAAIAEARRDVAKLLGKPGTESIEKKIFADLAALARQSMPEQGEVPAAPAILRTLKLVEDLDDGMSASPDTPDADRFFQQDAHLFAPAPHPAQAAPLQDAPVSAETQKGAKLVIVHAAERAAEAPAPDHQPENTHQPALAAEAAVLPPSSITDSQRIVIVRKQPDELLEMPLLSPEPGNQNAPAA